MTRIKIAIAAAFIAFPSGRSSIASAANRAVTPPEAIRSEIAKLEKSISLTPNPDPNFVSAVSRAKSELEASRLFAALYRLQSPISAEAMRGYLASKTAIRALAPFEAEWKNAGREISREDSALNEARIAQLPAAVRALVEANRAQARVYYKSALLYGRETEAGNGLAYIGLAKGNLAFAVFASSLRFAPAGPDPARSPRSEIGDLEHRLLQTYDRPGLSSRPGLYENINSTLKAAGELDRDGKFDGAVSQLLDAELYLDLASAEGSPAADPERLRKEGAEALGRLDAKATDETIGRMIWELAQGNLAPEKDGSHPPEKLARASVQLERVLPRYFELRETTASEAVAPAGGPAKVRITLVRWPYT